MRVKGNELPPSMQFQGWEAIKGRPRTIIKILCSAQLNPNGFDILRIPSIANRTTSKIVLLFCNNISMYRFPFINTAFWYIFIIYSNKTVSQYKCNISPAIKIIYWTNIVNNNLTIWCTILWRYCSSYCHYE